MPAMFLNFLDLHFLSITPFWYTIVAHTQLLLAFHGVWPSVDQYELSATIILNSLSIALFHDLLAISISLSIFISLLLQHFTNYWDILRI